LTNIAGRSICAIALSVWWTGSISRYYCISDSQIWW
jgi:hypothetical protein